jgi:transposase
VRRQGPPPWLRADAGTGARCPGLRPVVPEARLEALLTDKGYDCNAIREELANAEVKAVIPAKRNRRNPAPHDRKKYRWRNLIERLFNKLKNWRRIATRYDKIKQSNLGFVAPVSIKLWIPFVHET